MHTIPHQHLAHRKKGALYLRTWTLKPTHLTPTRRTLYVDPKLATHTEEKKKPRPKLQALHLHPQNPSRMRFNHQQPASAWLRMSVGSSVSWLVLLGLRPTRTTAQNKKR